MRDTCAPPNERLSSSPPYSRANGTPCATHWSMICVVYQVIWPSFLAASTRAWQDSGSATSVCTLSAVPLTVKAAEACPVTLPAVGELKVIVHCPADEADAVVAAIDAVL